MRERETDGNKRCDEKHEGNQEIFHLHLEPEERKPQEGAALIKADELLEDSPGQTMLQWYICGEQKA